MTNYANCNPTGFTSSRKPDVPGAPLCVCGHKESEHGWVTAIGYEFAQVIVCLTCHDDHIGSNPYTGCSAYRPAQ